MNKLILCILIALAAPTSILHAEDKVHSKETEEKHEGHGDESHGEAGEKHEEEENEAVGPEKGIQEADEHKGFKLSPEALKNFEIKTVKLQKASPWTLPSIVVVRSGEEVNLFRLRDGFFKRIDFTQVRKLGAQLVVSSPDLQTGDEIVTSGLGLLRIAELSAFGGLAEGHSH
jgi:hypothetical protein